VYAAGKFGVYHLSVFDYKEAKQWLLWMHAVEREQDRDRERDRDRLRETERETERGREGERFIDR
jgi:hypothetical protein